jgi:hypothetical protein
MFRSINLSTICFDKKKRGLYCASTNEHYSRSTTPGVEVHWTISVEIRPAVPEMLQANGQTDFTHRCVTIMRASHKVRTETWRWKWKHFHSGWYPKESTALLLCKQITCLTPFVRCAALKIDRPFMGFAATDLCEFLIPYVRMSRTATHNISWVKERFKAY